MKVIAGLPVFNRELLGSVSSSIAILCQQALGKGAFCVQQTPSLQNSGLCILYYVHRSSLNEL